MRTCVKLMCGGVLGLGLALAIPPSAVVAQTAQANSPVIEARKRVAEAEKVVKDLKAEQTRIKDKTRAEFETKEEWKSTVSKHKKAKAEYDAAKAAASKALQSKPEYKKLLQEKDAILKRQDALNKQKDPDPKALTKVGTELAAKSTAIKAMEKDVLERDDKTLDAKDALDIAEKDLKRLDDEVEGALSTDPDYTALLAQVEQAETAVTQAKEAAKAAKPVPQPRAPKPPRAARSGKYAE